MRDIRITVMRITEYPELMQQYENPMEHACDMQVGQSFLVHNQRKPEGFCDSAWETVAPFVMALSCGAEKLYDGWMQNPRSAMLSCNDGFRPVSFYLEALEETP